MSAKFENNLSSPHDAPSIFVRTPHFHRFLFFATLFSLGFGLLPTTLPPKSLKRKGKGKSIEGTNVSVCKRWRSKEKGYQNFVVLGVL